MNLTKRQARMLHEVVVAQGPDPTAYELARAFYDSTTMTKAQMDGRGYQARLLLEQLVEMHYIEVTSWVVKDPQGIPKTWRATEAGRLLATQPAICYHGRDHCGATMLKPCTVRPSRRKASA